MSYDELAARFQKIAAQAHGDLFEAILERRYWNDRVGALANLINVARQQSSEKLGPFPVLKTLPMKARKKRQAHTR